jgi:hypothetical protein
VSFTADELRRLQIADQAEDGRQRTRRKRATVSVEADRVRALDQRLANKAFGRPRKPPVNESADRRREQKRAAYYRKKLTQETQP